MTNKRTLKKITLKIFLFSLILSVLGFLIDLNELDPSLLQNIKDIFLMTFLFFSFGIILYLLTILFQKIRYRISQITN